MRKLHLLLVLALLITGCTQENLAGQAYEGDERFSEANFTVHERTQQEVSVQVSDHAIYKHAYYTEGDVWNKTTLTGEAIPDTQFLHGAQSFTIDITPQATHIIIYSCSADNGTWSCHENKWQAKAIESYEEPTPQCTGEKPTGDGVVLSTKTPQQDKDWAYGDPNEACEWTCEQDYEQNQNTCTKQEEPPEDDSEYYSADGTQHSPKPLHYMDGGDPLGYLLGLIEWDGKYRLYANVRAEDHPIYFESSNLEDWSGPHESSINGNMFMFQHEEAVYGYKEHEGALHIYKDFNGEKFETHVGEAYDWKIDGSISMHFSTSGHFRSFGRVRGNDNPIDEGGWGGEVPPYPEPPFDDRRGISYHASKEFAADWSKNRQLVDPADVFDGYHEEDEDFVPDFYDPNVMHDAKAMPTIFWKQKIRQVDRGEELPESRRYRLTGEVYPIPAVYDNQEIQFNFEHGSIIPREFHEVRAGDVGWDTVDPDKMEIGEIYILPKRVEKNGYVYLFYKYRNMHHYEGTDDPFSGIYSYRMKEDAFESMFDFEGASEEELPPELEDRPDQFPVLDTDMRDIGASYRPTGIIDWDGKTRIYYLAGGEVGYVESENLYDWSQPVVLDDMPTNQRFIWGEGEVYCYATEDGEAYMMDEFDPETGCQNTMTPDGMYDWGLDGTQMPSHVGGDIDFIQFGRIRGEGSQSTGSWGDIWPDYPRAEDFPKIQEAFEDSWYDAEKYIQDRRGVSLHLSDDGYEWSSEMLLDPQDLDLPGFRGWNDQDANGIADLYSAVAIDKERVLVKAYMKEKDRLIDRKLDNVRRRFRFTGETIIIPAVFRDGELTITSVDSVVPEEYHERIVTADQAPSANREPVFTNPGVPEVGQMTPENRVLYRYGKAFITYYYRDDIHYEGGWDGQREGIYMYAMDEEDFNELFE